MLHIHSRKQDPGTWSPVAIGIVVVAIALTSAACRGGTSEQPPVTDAPAAVTPAVEAPPSGPLSIQWTDADVEKMAQRIGYGSNPAELLARNADGGLLFVPQTDRDHIASQFFRLVPQNGEHSLELVLDAKSPGGFACEGSLQDQAFNTLVTVPCRTAGQHKASAKIPGSVTSVRIYFPSSNRQQVRLPAQVTVTEHQ